MVNPIELDKIKNETKQTESTVKKTKLPKKVIPEPRSAYQLFVEHNQSCKNLDSRWKSLSESMDEEDKHLFEYYNTSAKYDLTRYKNQIDLFEIHTGIPYSVYRDT